MTAKCWCTMFTWKSGLHSLTRVGWRRKPTGLIWTFLSWIQDRKPIYRFLEQWHHSKICPTDSTEPLLRSDHLGKYWYYYSWELLWPEIGQWRGGESRLRRTSPCMAKRCRAPFQRPYSRLFWGILNSPTQQFGGYFMYFFFDILSSQSWKPQERDLSSCFWPLSFSSVGEGCDRSLCSHWIGRFSILISLKLWLLFNLWGVLRKVCMHH